MAKDTKEQKKDSVKPQEEVKEQETPETPEEEVEEESKEEEAPKEEAKDTKKSIKKDKEETPEEPAFVTIKSADGRALEYSVNGEFYKGKEITVPVEVAGEARDALEKGGFFLKD